MAAACSEAENIKRNSLMNILRLGIGLDVRSNLISAQAAPSNHVPFNLSSQKIRLDLPIGKLLTVETELL